MSLVLEATGVTKTFADGKNAVHVLRGASLDVARGEIVALEGRSGSGKTTLLSILGCILTPTAGRVVVDGTPVDARKLVDIRRRSIGFVFQQFNLFPALTAVENVEYALGLKGVRGKPARREAEEMLDLVGLGDRRDFLPRDLSGGQKQRVAIARALVRQPAVILADEPTANLDTEVGAQILDLFRTVTRQRGSGLLVVTHDPRVRAVADRTLEIRDGIINRSGNSGKGNVPLCLAS